MRHLISQYVIVGGDQHQPFQLRLRDEHPVEWVVVNPIERAGPFSVGYQNWQRLKAMRFNHAGNRSAEDELARGPFDGDLPHGDRTDEDLVFSRSDGFAHPLRKMGVFRVPPDKRMRVEQKFQTLQAPILQFFI
jgi:hypothetical protein